MPCWRRLLIGLSALAVLSCLATPAFADDMTPGPGTGTVGSDGSNGHAGSTGQPGSAGQSGQRGSAGTSGRSGSTGSPPGTTSGTSTKSVGPAEDFAGTDILFTDLGAPTVQFQPGPEPAAVVESSSADLDLAPAAASEPTATDRAVLVTRYLLAMLGLFLAASVLIPMEVLTRLLGAAPNDRSGPRRSSVRG